MISIVGYIVLVVMAVFVQRVTAWGKRAVARHRERFIAQGWKERNRPWRLRQEKYLRVFFVSYVVFGLLSIMAAPAPHVYGAAAKLFMALVTDVAAMFFSIIPAAIVWRIVRFVVEWVHPIGERALKMRDEELYRVMELERHGEYGTGKILRPEQIGLATSSGWSERKRQPIVFEEEAGQ